MTIRYKSLARTRESQRSVLAREVAAPMIIRYTDPAIDRILDQYSPADILLPRLDNTMHAWMARHIETCLHARLGRTVYVTL